MIIVMIIGMIGMDGMIRKRAAHRAAFFFYLTAEFTSP